MGTDAVTSWTARKDINIFKKHFILLPINIGRHWSLCVVVNPAHVSNVSCDNDTDGTQPFACILLLDSLIEGHDKYIVAKHVRKWLNAEWKRLTPEHGNVDPFNKLTMGVYTPESKFLSMPTFLCHYHNEGSCSHVSKYPVRTTHMIVVFLSAAMPLHFLCCVKGC